jgi:hypothetical protein
VEGGEGVDEESVIGFFESISPTLILRRLKWFDFLLTVSVDFSSGWFSDSCAWSCEDRCLTSTSDSSLAKLEIEGWMGGSGLVTFEVAR